MEDIKKRLEGLKKSMVELSEKMVSIADPEFKKHGEELLGASEIVEGWIEGIEVENIPVLCPMCNCFFETANRSDFNLCPVCREESDRVVNDIESFICSGHTLRCAQVMVCCDVVCECGRGVDPLKSIKEVENVQNY